MTLLNESKRMWLLSYIALMLIACVFFKCELPAYKTIGLMLFGMLLLMFVEFLFIVLFGWISWWGRIIISVVFLAGVIYGGIEGYLCKWYIIVPTFLAVEIYHLWNIGGVINCLIADAYKKMINETIVKGKELFEQYSNGVDDYNLSNQLNFFSSVRKKKEPNWDRLTCYVNGVDMFFFKDALIGRDLLLSTLLRKKEKVDEIISKLVDKNQAIYSNQLIREEYNLLADIVSKSDSIGIHNTQLSNQKEQINRTRIKRIKKEKKILKRRL